MLFQVDEIFSISQASWSFSMFFLQEQVNHSDLIFRIPLFLFGRFSETTRLIALVGH